jgi:hypothetical protein
MTLGKHFLALSLGALVVIRCSTLVFAETSSSTAKPGPATASVDHDGQHDFDALAGAWKGHTKYRAHPFAGSDTWIESEYTEMFQNIWGGRATLEVSVDGSGLSTGLMLYTYNPQSHQWYVYFASSKDGKVGLPNVGEFRNGRGEFFVQDTLNGKYLLNRYVWSKMASSSPHFEESWSSDGGRTWDLVRIVDLARFSDDTGNAHPAPAKPDENTGKSTQASGHVNGEHDFDFELGSWKIHLKRRLQPLTGSNSWVDFDGTSATRMLWDGRAQIEEFETDGAAGHIEGLTLRTFNPQTRDWRLYWANSKDGVVVVPQIGKFKDGIGEFYAQDTLDGKTILVRFIWSKTDTSAPHFEQAFSEDWGKTWEVNWITDQTRVGDPAASGSQEQPSKLVPSVASNVDREISNVEKQIVDVAEAMPEEKYNFSPESLNIPGADYKGVRAFAVQLKHVAASNYFIWSPLTGDKLPEGLGDGNGSPEMKSKADIIKFLKDSFALGHRAAATLTTENMLQTVGQRKSTRLHLAEFGVAHAFDHYGQMVEYLRMNGIVPPASRGKSD